MGLLDRFLGGGDDEEEDEEWSDETPIEETWVDEEDDDEWEEDEDWEEEEDEGPREWDTAYKFLDDALQQVGFSGCNEFVKKAMVYKINRSPMYRDRVKVGRETMQMVADTMNSINHMNGQESRGYDELADELQAANRLIDEVEQFSNKEEQMAYDIMGLAQDAIDVYANKKGGAPGNVQTSSEVSNQEL